MAFLMHAKFLFYFSIYSIDVLEVELSARFATDAF